MKNVYKSLALVCIGLATIACVEENFEPNNGYDTTPGNDIVFTATAQMDNVDTKTVYGAVNEAKNMIDINWAQGDRIQIASLEAAGEQNAEYAVGFEEKGDNYTGSHSATSLNKTGDAALQWSSKSDYNFYAMYPSPASFPEGERSNVSLDISETAKKMTAWLPIVQINQTHTSPIEVNGIHVIEPNMDYAYMYAASSFSRYNKDGSENKNGISLQFKPAVTALQFKITANTIGLQADQTSHITITDLSLLVKSKDISGKYTYDFAGKFEVNNIESGHNRVTMELGAGYKLDKGDVLDVTFLTLPQEITKDDELKLQIFFTVGGAQQVRTATIKNTISPCKKYLYNDLLLPVIEANVTGSNWVSALDPMVLISQVSIPAAGNAFSYAYSEEASDAKFVREQVYDYITLWKMGVRGFEFSTSLGSTSSSQVNQNSLENEFFVCNGAELTNATYTDLDGTTKSLTFGNAFRSLEAMLDKEEYKDEFLVVIATYKNYTNDGGLFPETYIRHLDKFLTDNADNFTHKVGDKVVSRLVKFDSSLKTIGDLRGKIVVLVRIGDYDYYKNTSYNGQTHYDALQAAISDITNNITIIEDWGTGVDAWDRRYSGVARQQAYGATTYAYNMEDYQWAISSTSPTFTEIQKFKDNTTTGITKRYKYDFLTNTNVKMHIQEWARVVPETIEYFATGQRSIRKGKLTGSWSENNKGNYLFTRWEESLSQKKAMINETFETTIATRYQDAHDVQYINSLAGYYITQSHVQSGLPYMTDIEDTDKETTLYRYYFRMSKQGMGGDLAGMAADMNWYFYNLFNSVKGTNKQGPLGLVMMNYIGADANTFTSANSEYIGTTGHATSAQAAEASQALPNLILMNNFTFPLATLCANCKSDPCVCEDQDVDLQGTVTVSDFDNIYLNGGDAISFE